MVEDHILNTTANLVNQACLDELWDLALNKIVAVLRTQIVSVILIVDYSSFIFQCILTLNKYLLKLCEAIYEY